MFLSEDGEGGDNPGSGLVYLALMHFNVYRGISVGPFCLSLFLHQNVTRRGSFE